MTVAACKGALYHCVQDRQEISHGCCNIIVAYLVSDGYTVQHTMVIGMLNK